MKQLRTRVALRAATPLRLAVALSLCGIGSLAYATDIEFSGYMRAGTGVNTRGGTQVCFKLPGADTKWRLGNECDYTIEPNFATTIAKGDDGSEWRVHFMPSVYRAWGQSEIAASGPGVTNSGTDELITRFGQVYAYGRNLPQLNGGMVWAGRRFYNRVQLGINDQFLENNDGDGTGLENMNVGIGKLSVAFMLNGRNASNDNRYVVPISLREIKTFENSALAIHAGYQKQTSTQNQLTGITPEHHPSGHSLGLYHTTQGTLGGSTFVGLRTDRNDTSRGALDQSNNRIVLQQTGFVTSAKTTWDLITEYRINKVNGVSGENKWYSLGGRTDTYISGPFRFLAELGTDLVKPSSGSRQQLTKLTLALAMSAGPEANSRPTVRFFYTYAKWNDAARQAMRTAGGINETRSQEVFGDRTSGSSIGAQVETWW